MVSEHVEQREFVQWFRQNVPYIIYAIPNGGSRGRLEGARMKCEGVLAGIPDLHVPALKLWIEMKRVGGRASPAQLQIHERLRREGQTVVICEGKQQAIDVVTQELERRGEKPQRRERNG